MYEKSILLSLFMKLTYLFSSYSSDEIDSYMYQTVGHDVIHLYSEALGLPLYRGNIEGRSLQIGSDYTEESNDEVEDLYHLLARVKEMESIEAVSVGAILSNYQRVRVENVYLLKSFYYIL